MDVNTSVTERAVIHLSLPLSVCLLLMALTVFSAEVVIITHPFMHLG